MQLLEPIDLFMGWRSPLNIIVLDFSRPNEYSIGSEEIGNAYTSQIRASSPGRWESPGVPPFTWKHVPNCVQKLHHQQGRHFMKWRGICGDKKTQLLVLRGTMHVQRYVDEVLWPVALHSYNIHEYPFFK